MQINFGSSSRGSGGAPGVAGRLGGTLFGLAFAAIGLAVAGMVGAAWLKNARVYGWRPSECLVTASRVEEHPGAPAEGEQYKLVVEYRYPDPADPSGGERTGSVVSPSYRGSSDIESAQELAARYPQGARVACFVDPADPGHATLRRPSLWFGLALLVPLLFVLFGLGLAVGVWRRARANAESPAGEALSRSAAGGSGAGCIVLFFALFLLAGLGALGFFVRPVLRLLSAGSRIEVPATVLYSGVREHSGDDSTTYGVEVLYAYEVGGRTYKSTRYDFSSGSSSGRESKAAKVAAIPAGTRTICYVDPRHPEDAVLDRAFRPIYLLGLIPLVFVAVGGIGMAAALRYRRRKAAGSGAPDWLPQPRALAVGVPEAAEGGVAEGPILLAPKSGPWGRFLGMTFVALFWNGLVSVFLYQVVQGWRSGQGDGCLTAFLVPFVLVGLALIVAVPYQLLALFNPRPQLEIDRARLRPGEPARLAWRFTGSAGRIDRLAITIEGREEAQYRRGTTTATDRSTFATIQVVESAQPTEIAGGAALLAIPSGSMHSFSASHNKIVWTLCVSGAIRGWPDVSEEFDLVVLPQAPQSSGREG